MFCCCQEVCSGNATWAQLVLGVLCPFSGWCPVSEGVRLPFPGTLGRFCFCPASICWSGVELLLGDLELWCLLGE